MKKHYLLLLLAFGIAQAQIVNIPDANFKNKLLQSSATEEIAWNSVGDTFKIDSNNDGQIQVSEALAVVKLRISDAMISDLSGIASFTNLKELECYGNALSVLDVSALTQLVNLDCADNALTTLNVSGLSSLTWLNTSTNELTSLNLSGLTSLEVLNARNNNLSSVGTLPFATLKSIQLGGNQLTSFNLPATTTTLEGVFLDHNLLTSLILPTSAPNLVWVSVGWNQLTSLTVSSASSESFSLSCPSNQISALTISVPVTVLNCNQNNLSSLSLPFPADLATLDCSYNQFTSLSLANMTALTTLNCSHNQLTSLSAVGCDAIEDLYCDNNQLNTLILPDGPTLLFTLDCAHNLLTSLELKQTIEYLDCSYNQLSSLSLVTSGGVLGHFDCSHNQISDLELGNFDYFEINCSSNPLENLDVSHLAGLSVLYCDDTDLISLILGNIQVQDVSFENNPQLAYVCVHPNQIAFLEGLVQQYGYAAEVNSYCSFTPGAFYHIEGTQTLDTNGNGCDAGDPVFPNLRWDITNGSVTGTIISDENGHYRIPAQAGSHTLTPVFTHPYFSSSPASATVSFPSQATPFNQDFCIAPNGIHHDLQISIMPLGAAVPGFDTSYRVKVRNVGTVVESGSISLSYSGTHTTFVSASPSPSSQWAGSVIWELGALPSLSEADFIVTLHLNSPVDTPPLDLGDTLVYTATALNSSEETPADNTVLLSDPVVNALDPNDKTCLEGNTIGPDMAGKYLHYLIRFENTGNYPAQIVTVEDMIDTTKFDISTLEPLDGSHAFTTRITGNKVEFIFNNIMLPFDDANNDGWVLFRIKTKPTVVLGDSVSNTAGIYFNFNPPVITNTATTTFATMGVDSKSDTSFTIWPNPASDRLNIDSKSGYPVNSLHVYDLTGREVLYVKGSDLRSIDVTSLAAGGYVVKLVSGATAAAYRFTKQ